MNTKAWDAFFGNPLINSYLTEAEEIQQPDQVDNESADTDIEKLAGDFKNGHLNQDDIVNMYKSGKISKDDIQQIIQVSEGGDEQGGEQSQDEEGPTEEELLSQQIDQTNDLFIKFSLYDKINELSDKLLYFQENFEDLNSDMYEKVLQLKEFLNILSNLVFNIETPVAYQMYGSILLQLTDLFTEYNQKIESNKTNEIQEKEKKEDYRDGDKTTDPVEIWTSKNKSHLMPDEETS